MKAEHSAGVILFREKQGKREYVILKYSYKEDYWGLCKGIIEKNEDPKQAAIREVKEETSLEVLEFIEFQDQSTYYFKRDGELTHKTVTWFAAKVLDEIDGKVSAEHQELRWVEFDEAMQLVTYKGDKEVVRKVEEEIKKN